MIIKNITFKDSKIPWIWNIPEYWDVKKLKYVFKYITWATPDSWKNNYYNNWNNNWITISDLSWKYTGESKNKITDLAVKEKNMKIVPKWSLLYSFKLSVWQLAFASEDTYINEAIFAVIEKEWLNLNFWYYALWSYFISNANENIYWAKIFNQFIIDNWFLIIPSIKNQNIIANYLDQKTTQINTFIENKKRLIRLLEEQKISIINKAVTKWLDENIKMKDSWIPWIWEIPEDWEVRRLKYVSDIQTWNKNTEDNLVEWKYPFFVRSENIEKLDSYSLDCEAILTAWDWVWAWKVFHYYNWKFAFHQRVYALTNFKGINWKYLYYFLKLNFYNEVLRLSAKSTVDSLRLPMIQNFIVPFFDTSIQKEIVNYIEKQTSKINQTIETIEKEIKLIEEYRDSLIYQAVTWKLNIQ